MESNLEQRIKKYAKKNKRKKVWMKILSALSVTVVFCTTYALILPAITQERETFCGAEEHTHSENCAAAEEKVLICELFEENGHLHSEECSASSLICETEENHLHSEECYSEEELICEKPEGHMHSEECYETSLVCELPESEGHGHAEECFVTESLVCLLEEHTHSLSCYSDETADIETEEQWSASFASEKLGDVVSENLITIAKSQLGYHESTKNYIVLEDGETIKGRTRYGEWYGEPYADWNVLFAGFCLDYAKAEIPFDADIEKWIELLSAPETDIYKPNEEHNALAGDIVFLDEDKDGKADRAGIIIEITENGFKTVIGDYGDSVQSTDIEAADETVAGFAAIAIPSPYLCGLEEHIHDNCFDENGNIVCGFEEHIHSESCLEEKTEESLTEYFCGFDEHAHTEECFDENGNPACGIEEHTHSESCFEEEAEEEYFCGFDEHAHTDECFDENGNIVCGIEEHAHTDECKISFENLPEEEKLRIEEVIRMINELPTADEIDAKIMEFEEAEDYEGEEAWLTEVYQQVGMAYKYYMNLPENHRKFVTNSEKLMELEHIWSMAVLVETEIAKTVSYNQNMFTDTALFVVYTQGSNGYYAFDGSGAAVPINISADGTITADVSNRNELLWSFSGSGSEYLIKNASSGRYMHAYPNNGSGVTTTGAYTSVIVSASGGVRIRSNSEYAYLDENSGTFKMTQTQSSAAVYNFGIYDTSNEIYIWVDGTNGGMDYLSGSDNTGYSVLKGESFTLPESWKTPDRYNYKVRGWYDVVGGKYYPAGAEINPEASMVLYADWIPATYDIGQFNADASPTVSTNDFITTKVFDYSPFFNIPYADANVTVNASGHSETWSIKSTQKGAGNLIFRDWSGGKLSYPNSSDNGDNKYTGGNTNANLLDDEIIDRLFGTGNAFNPATGTGVLGKTYLGTGDFLFQYCDDPANTEYYGYYYYDSLYHAASYNRSAQRFYVYDYLERAVDSSTADFLPLNSPYVNTNGRPVGTYSNSGQYGEYNGTTHYQYLGGSGVNAEYWFGIQTDIRFYLANNPGEKDSEGNTVNRGVNGEELVFDFTGDDDVWVFVDDILVLDIGGIHDALKGSINFSTGVVTVNGNTSALPESIGAGEHTLTMYYLERGASASNCRVKFNISTRYGLKLQKEDVLTRELLNGAEFTVFSDKACTNKVNLWKSHADYEAGNPSQSEFVVENGYTSFWGLAAGNTYYIKETKYPTNGGYGVANGIIVMNINSRGTATFEVIPDEEAEGSDLSGGFTVHGYKIDVENHEVNLVATNSKEEYGDEVTSVTVKKKWNDSLDHSGDSVTVYILANGYRIQEAVLNEANNWTHTWKNLPLNGDSGNPVTYTVEEGTVPGYFGTVTEMTDSVIETTEIVFEKATSIESGETYLLKTSSGYLAANNGALSWISSEETAKTSAGSRWIITSSGSGYVFENEAGQTLYYYTSGWNTRQFRAGNSPNSNTVLRFTSSRIYYRSGNTSYYFSGISGTNGSASSSSGNALTFELYKEVERTVTETVDIEGKGFLITNEPITVDNSVSFKVNKAWNTGNFASEKDYEQFTVTMKLLENGKDSGMSAQLMLKNGWTYTFTDLPKFDSGGNEIVYSVEEVFFSEDWKTEYGEITKPNGGYETTVTNVYRLHYELPQTGGGGTIFNIAGGIFALGAGFALIYRTNKKRRKEDTS